MLPGPGGSADPSFFPGGPAAAVHDQAAAAGPPGIKGVKGRTGGPAAIKPQQF